MTLIQVVRGADGTVSNGFERGAEEWEIIRRIGIIQSTVLFILVIILRIVLHSLGNLLSR